MDSNEPHRVPLHEEHLALTAQMVSFAGYLMPVKYTSIKEEHHAVRQQAGLFDVSHMGQVEVRGVGALAQLNYWITNDVSVLPVGKALYTVMCNDEGGVIDDLVVYRLEEDRFLLCVNAANRRRDMAHFLANKLDVDVEIDDLSDRTVQLAIQGPRAEVILSRLTEYDLSEIPFFGVAQTSVAGVDTLVARTGYTGEDGFELYLPAEHGRQVFRSFLEFVPDELTLCGLGCRDTLRLEAGLALHGQDLDETISPLEGGLGWVVKLDKIGDFIGKSALRAEKSRGPARVRRGFILEGRGVLRSGYSILHEAQEIGQITSGGYSPTLESSIGLGYLQQDSKSLEKVEVEIRGKSLLARVVRPPFYRRT